jgi:hypothetical protein
LKIWKKTSIKDNQNEILIDGKQAGVELCQAQIKLEFAKQ